MHAFKKVAALAVLATAAIALPATADASTTSHGVTVNTTVQHHSDTWPC